MTDYFFHFFALMLKDKALVMARGDDYLLLDSGALVYRDRIEHADASMVEYHWYISLYADRFVVFQEKLEQFGVQLLEVSAPILPDTEFHVEPSYRWEFFLGGELWDCYLTSDSPGVRLQKTGSSRVIKWIELHSGCWTDILDQLFDSDFYKINYALQKQDDEYRALIEEIVALGLPLALQVEPGENTQAWLEAQRDLLRLHTALTPQGYAATVVEQHFHNAV